MTYPLSIDAHVERLRQCREVVADLEATLHEQRRSFEQSMVDILEALREAKASRDDAERQVRALALAEFTATGEKHPHPALTIREGTPREVVDAYDADVALAYALEKGVALTVDSDVLETYLRAVPPPMRPSWFRVRSETPEPTVAIARAIPAPEMESAV